MGCSVRCGVGGPMNTLKKDWCCRARGMLGVVWFEELMECSRSYEGPSSPRFFLIHPGPGMERRPVRKLNRYVLC